MKAIFERTKNIAVIGMSKNPEKSAYSIPAYMKSVGYNVIPVNPTTNEIVATAEPEANGAIKSFLS